MNQTSKIQFPFLQFLLLLLAITLQYKVSLAQQTNINPSSVHPPPSTVHRSSSTISNLRTKTFYLDKNKPIDTLQLDTLTVVPNSVSLSLRSFATSATKNIEYQVSNNKLILKSNLNFLTRNDLPDSLTVTYRVFPSNFEKNSLPQRPQPNLALRWQLPQFRLSIE